MKENNSQVLKERLEHAQSELAFYERVKREKTKGWAYENTSMQDIDRWIGSEKRKIEKLEKQIEDLGAKPMSDKLTGYVPKTVGEVVSIIVNTSEGHSDYQLACNGFKQGATFIAEAYYAPLLTAYTSQSASLKLAEGKLESNRIDMGLADIAYKQKTEQLKNAETYIVELEGKLERAKELLTKDQAIECMGFAYACGLKGDELSDTQIMCNEYLDKLLTKKNNNNDNKGTEKDF